MQAVKTPQKSIRVAIIWLAFFAILAGVLAASFGPKNTEEKLSAVDNTSLSSE